MTRNRGTLQNIDPLNKVPVEESQKKVKKGSLVVVPLILPRISHFSSAGRGGENLLLSERFRASRRGTSSGGGLSQLLSVLLIDPDLPMAKAGCHNDVSSCAGYRKHLSESSGSALGDLRGLKAIKPTPRDVFGRRAFSLGGPSHCLLIDSGLPGHMAKTP